MVSSRASLFFIRLQARSFKAARFSPPFRHASLKRASLPSQRQQESKAALDLGGQEHEKMRE